MNKSGQLLKGKIIFIGYKDEDGNPQRARIGIGGVVEIKEHLPQGEGDRLFYDIVFEKSITRVFHPVTVTRSKGDTPPISF